MNPEIARELDRRLDVSPVHPILMWSFYDAPTELRKLAPRCDDGDWVAYIPACHAGDSRPLWLNHCTRFGHCDIYECELPTGARVYIGAHN